MLAGGRHENDEDGQAVVLEALGQDVRHITCVNLFLKRGCPNNYSAQAVSGADKPRLDRSLHAPICQAQAPEVEALVK